MRRRLASASLIPLAILLTAFAAGAAETGLPLPRFVTLGSDEVNVRTGPGQRYPVEWVFVRDEMPVEIVAEYDAWRKIRDFEGSEGWVHGSLLSGRRGFVLTAAEISSLRTEPRDDAPVVARAEPGVMGRLLACPGPAAPAAAWCYVEAGGYRGWLRRAALWGVYPDETVE